MSTERLKIWHVGNWCIHIGQTYVESPFEAPSKDVEVLNYAKPLIDALRKIPSSEVITQPSWELYRMSPDEFEERLDFDKMKLESSEDQAGERIRIAEEKLDIAKDKQNAPKQQK